MVEFCYSHISGGSRHGFMMNEWNELTVEVCWVAFRPTMGTLVYTRGVKYSKWFGDMMCGRFTYEPQGCWSSIRLTGSAR